MSEPARKIAPVLRLKAPKLRRIRGHLTGELVRQDDEGPWVDFPGNPHGPVRARTTVPLGRIVIPEGAPPSVLLVFDEERSSHPVIVGLFGTDGPPEARVDGRRVVLEAEDEIVLRCGEASITLRRNGRVVIRGAYVETRSRGVNRIKGGTVQIN